MRGVPALSPIPAAIVHAHRFGTATAWVAVGACLAASVVAGIRWLRVAQREHYLAGSVTRFARRWWLTSPEGVVPAVLAGAAIVASVWWPVVALGCAAVVAVGPIGLGVRGRTSPLRWTRRLRTLAVISALLAGGLVVVGWLIGIAPVVAAGVALFTPLVVDAACGLTAPVERRLADPFVARAAARLQRVGPTVVAITGSFGKTSTKGHVAQLVGPSRPLVASPASFNNRVGLARAINEHLTEGTEVFVAEMGTYGSGEIADLCQWCPPDIAVITAVGPVHLERFGTEDRILEAKSEILERAGRVVLPVDDGRLAALADRSEAAGKQVLRCSTVDRGADVCVERTADDATISVYVGGDPVAKDVPAPTGIQPSNLACAVAVALALGVDARTVGDRVGGLVAADHRLATARAPSGVTVVDDTYNANPAGAGVALVALAALAARPRGDTRDTAAGAQGSGAVAEPPTDSRSGRRLVVVTPGMVELGRRQSDENERFGAATAAVASDVVIVGRTNRRALLAGVASALPPGPRVQWVRHRQEAVDWVRRHLGPGDAVLYENDLPDHYP